MAVTAKRMLPAVTANFVEQLLRHAERDVHGLNLVDVDECPGVVGLHQIARLHQKAAGAPVDGRTNEAISKIELRRFERRFVDVERGFGAVDGGFVGAKRFVLRIKSGLIGGVLILRDQPVLGESGIALRLLFRIGGLDGVARQIRLRLRDERFILCDGGLRLIDGLLIGAGIDFENCWPFRTSSPSRNRTLVSSPPICAFTAMTATASTAPIWRT